MNHSTPSPPNGSWYEIRIQGQLDRRWTAWLGGMSVTPDDGGTTLLRGRLVDQPALHGLLARFRDLGVPLISVNQVDPAASAHLDDPEGDSDVHP